MSARPNATFWLAMVWRFQVKADISHTTTPAQIFENDPRRTLVGPCGRLVDFHDRLACLDLLADAVTHDSSFVFDFGQANLRP
ncbi:hypothetical protein, partial [Bradyrhizobium genosp. SA-3]|uniref:hypothetical protein n=1 Tax=Bradyrhizobium genosp. SA-3 TaxID=508868 RepID=UPI001028B665